MYDEQADLRVAVKAVSIPSGVKGIWSTRIVVEMRTASNDADICDSKAVTLHMNTEEFRVKRQVEAARPSRQRQVANRPVLYFSNQLFDFGFCDVGDEREERVKLCNRGKSDVVVRLQILQEDPCFSVRHRKVRIRARSFVLIPVRFHPARGSLYEQALECTSAMGQSTVLLCGTGTGEFV